MFVKTIRGQMIGLLLFCMGPSAVLLPGGGVSLAYADPLEQLDAPMMQHLLSFLDLDSLSSASQVSWQWREQSIEVLKRNLSKLSLQQLIGLRKVLENDPEWSWRIENALPKKALRYQVKKYQNETFYYLDFHTTFTEVWIPGANSGVRIGKEDLLSPSLVQVFESQDPRNDPNFPPEEVEIPVDLTVKIFEFAQASKKSKEIQKQFKSKVDQFKQDSLQVPPPTLIQRVSSCLSQLTLFWTQEVITGSDEGGSCHDRGDQTERPPVNTEEAWVYSVQVNDFPNHYAFQKRFVGEEFFVPRAGIIFNRNEALIAEGPRLNREPILVQVPTSLVESALELEEAQRRERNLANQVKNEISSLGWLRP